MKIEDILALEVSTTIAKTKTFTAKVGDFPLEAIHAFLAYGFQRKFNDAVGGAKRGEDDYTPEMKVADAEALIADYRAGKISKRREGGTGATTEVLAGRKVMRAMLPQLLADKDLKAFRELEPVEQLAKLDAWVDANSESLADAIAEELAAMEAAAKRKAGLKGLKIAI